MKFEFNFSLFILFIINYYETYASESKGKEPLVRIFDVSNDPNY